MLSAWITCAWVGLVAASHEGAMPGAMPGPPPPLVPNGDDICIRDRYSRDAHENSRCNVQIGVAPCSSMTYAADYTGLKCLYIDKPFYFAFVCAKCVTQTHQEEQNVQRCLMTHDTNRFSILRTGSGFSMSVTRGKGHGSYNTPYFNMSAPVAVDDYLYDDSGGAPVPKHFPVVAIRRGMDLRIYKHGDEVLSLAIEPQPRLHSSPIPSFLASTLAHSLGN